jgi:hypothetical protein
VFKDYLDDIDKQLFELSFDRFEPFLKKDVFSYPISEDMDTKLDLTKKRVTLALDFTNTKEYEAIVELLLHH